MFDGAVLSLFGSKDVKDSDCRLCFCDHSHECSSLQRASFCYSQTRAIEIKPRTFREKIQNCFSVSAMQKSLHNRKTLDSPNSKSCGNDTPSLMCLSACLIQDSLDSKEFYFIFLNEAGGTCTYSLLSCFELCESGCFLNA